MEPDQLAANRRQLAILARPKKMRIVPRKELPCDSYPEQVQNPEDRQPFTEPAAWELIARLLEDDTQEIEIVALDKPPGKTAYVMKHALPTGLLYTKVHFGHGPRIEGRSFHYSDYGTEKT